MPLSADLPAQALRPRQRPVECHNRARSARDGQRQWRAAPETSTRGETDARQVFHRLAYTWTDWGKRYKYFTTEEDAQAFYDEMCSILARQMGAPNSPQWFNTGLYAVYGLKGPAQGHYFVNPDTGEVEKATSAYERPQPHACFILSIEDDLVNEGGIMDLITREARLFKYGSGTGTNYSKLRPPASRSPAAASPRGSSPSSR